MEKEEDKIVQIVIILQSDGFKITVHSATKVVEMKDHVSFTAALGFIENYMCFL